jgi:hypothetical protein
VNTAENGTLDLTEVQRALAEVIAEAEEKNQGPVTKARIRGAKDYC